MIWNNAMIRYCTLLGVVGIVVFAALKHSSTLKNVSQAKVIATCIQPIQDSMPKFDNAVGLVTSALPGIIKLIQHHKDVDHVQLQASNKLLTQGGPGPRGVNEDQIKRLNDVDQQLNAIVEPLVTCSNALRPRH